MTEYKDICFGSPYKTKDGQDKMKWTKVGTLIDKDGKQYVKLQFIPVGASEIFLSVFEPQQGGKRAGGDSRPSQGGARGSDPFANSPDFGDVSVDDDLPF